MVEFKGDYVMEVNARFWGSLQLAIDCGVDFPNLLLDPSVVSESYDSLVERTVPNKRLRWLLGDFDRLYLCAKQGRPQLVREVLAFLTPNFSQTKHETFRWRDPLPAWWELRKYIADVFRHR